jgi:hypothetical protein
MSDWTPSQQTQQEIQLFVQSLLERLPVLLGIDEAIAGCEVTNTDPYSTGTVPRYIKVRINDYLQDVYYRGQPQNLAVGDFVSVLHYRQGNIYEVFGSSGTTGATWQWKLLSPDGSIDPVIYTDNSGNTLTQTGAVLVGADASLIDFPEARLIVSQDDSGHSYAPNIAIVGESACDAATNAVGIGGVAKVVDNRQARGVVGRAVVDASADTGEAIGVQGLSNPTHAGGTNIGVLGTAANGANNFSFYGQSGILYNADNITLAAGKTVDGVEVSTHDHSGGAGMGVQIDIEDTITTEMDDTKVLMPDGAGGVEWGVGGGGGAPVVDGVNKTVKPGGGGDYTTIQAAVNYFKGKVITGACTITIDASTYAENVVIEELLTSKDAALTLVGDTRALAGFCMIDGSTINPASKANGGSGTCSLTYGANEIQVFGSTTNPNFAAGGIVAGDTLLILGNDGSLYERTVQEIPATTNIFILTTYSPAIGDTGSAVIIIPNRRIEPASGIALRSNVAIGIHVDGIYAQSTDTYGVYVSYGGMLDLATSLTQGTTGIYSADYISRIIMNDCASVSGTVISYPASSAGFIPDATTTIKGLVELATDAEAQAGTNTTVVITPANLRADVPEIPSASRGVRLNASGNLVLPAATAMGDGLAHPSSPLLQVRTSGLLDACGNTAVNDNNDYGASYLSARAKGTVASPASVVDGSVLGGFYARGHNGTAWAGNTGVIRMVAGETFSGGGYGTRLEFATTAIGATGRTTSMILKESGNLLLGTTTDGMTAAGSIAIAKDLAHRGTKLGFYNTAPAVKPTVTGSRGGNAALASLLTALAGLGLLTDSSS